MSRLQSGTMARISPSSAVRSYARSSAISDEDASVILGMGSSHTLCTQRHQHLHNVIISSLRQQRKAPGMVQMHPRCIPGLAAASTATAQEPVIRSYSAAREP